MRLSSTRRARAITLLGALSVAPAVLAAQPGGVSAGCTIDANTPKELAVLELQFQRAKGVPNAADRQSALKGIMKELDTKPERFAKNPAGYNLRLAQALTMWGTEAGVSLTPARGAIGYQSNPTETIDLIDALDASLKAIVAALPACEADVKGMRQNEVWLAVTRKALDASNAGQMDSASLYARRSLKLSADNPYPHYVMASAANAAKDRASAIGHWKMVVTTSGADTNYRDLKNQSQYLIAVNQFEGAMAASGAEKQTMARDAAASFKTLFGIMKDRAEAPSIVQSWSEALMMSGDTAAVITMYGDMKANPKNYSEGVLTLAASLASQLNKPDDATTLFEGALIANPYSHDALLNLPLMYNGKQEYAKMLPPARKLVEIEPNNHTGWMWFAYHAQGMANAVKIPTAKNKAAPTPAERKAITDANAERKAWSDTLLKYQAYADGLPVKVDVSGFTRGAKETTLALRFEQQAAAEGNYSVTVEFVDVAGATVGSATEKVGPVKKGESKNVTFKAAAPGAVGFRYKAIK